VGAAVGRWMQDASGAALKRVREEWPLGLSLCTCLAVLLFHHALLDDFSNPAWLAFVFLWLFLTNLASVLAVVRHADHLAVKLGEPYGTLVLTLSVTLIEAASISTVMLHGANNPTLVRDTLEAVLMIILNGMVGISLLVGGWKHREQIYNLQGANAYLGIIIPIAVLALVMPNFTTSTVGPTLSTAQEIFLISMSLGLYGAFLAVQAGRHRQFFVMGEEEESHDVHGESHSLGIHAVLLAVYMLPVVFLAEQLALPIDYAIETVHAPPALGGLTIALLVALPEGIGAARAALNNRLQRSVNIFLGSVLSTISLTIPAMLLIGTLTNHKIILGVQNAQEMLLLLTLFVSAITFASGRTNVLQGLVHLLLFIAYIVFLFAG
jgi:Ca2+:H+ antiporter